MASDPQTIASEWLAALTTALGSADEHAIANLFLPDGWLRDMLVFTWDVRSLEGRAKIAAYLANRLSHAQVGEVTLNEAAELTPRIVMIPTISEAGVELAFTFECRHGHGRAHARLLPDPNSDGAYKALSLFAELSDLAQHEEASTLPLRDDLTGIPGRDMQQEFEEWVQEVETKPYVLIVGAGQTGLHMAARFKQMDIPALVIERHPRIGDNWRNRYRALTLHTIRRHHTLLYQPYPSNWPEYTPASKLADWLELYASTQDLVVWTSAELIGRPVYDRTAHAWDVTVVREGSEVRLRPAHIVLATGTQGEPNVPDVPHMELFRGRVIHSAQFVSGAAFAGKRAVVVGAGNSAIDICQDLVLRGAGAVTMVQRSSTCVMSRDYIAGMQKIGFPENIPLDVADFKWASMPLGLLKKLMIKDEQAAWDSQRELHDKLRKGGVKLNMGPEGQGIYLQVTERGGGYWLDKGGAELIADGSIKVRSGVSPQKFTENALVLGDGTELEADVVVFATGYVNMREVNTKLFGEEVIGQTDEVYGIDCEGEIKGSYRPSGFPGLWFASGDFYVSRTMSKPLAIQLKAIQLGILKHDGRREGAVDGL